MPFATIGGEFQVNTAAGGDQYHADMVQLANGDLIAVWADSSIPGNRNVWGQRIGADGSLIGNAFLVSASAAGQQFEPAITATDNGGFAVSWTGDTIGISHNNVPSINNIIVRRFDANGDPVLSPGDGELEFTEHDGNFPLDPAGNYTGEQHATSSAIISNPAAPGGYMVFYDIFTDVERIDLFDGNSWWRDSGIHYGTSFAADGADYGSGIIINAHDGDSGNWFQNEPDHPLTVPSITEPDAVVLADGTVVIVYTRLNLDGPDTTERVVVERWSVDYADPLNPLLVSQHDETILGDNTTYDFDADITVLADGGYVVVWVQWIGVTSHMQAQIFNADGSLRGSDFTITNAGDNHLEPSVSALADGRWVVVWSAEHIDGLDTSATAIKGMIFTADGEAAAPVFTVNTQTAGEQNAPVVTGLDDGNFMVAWTTLAGGDSDIHSQIFDPATFNGVADDITVIGGDFNDSIFGGSGANHIEGRDGDDGLSGEGGADTLIGGLGADVLNGGSDADAMEGGRGNDTYFVDNSGDSVSELAGQGNDTVWSSINFTLAANAEILRGLASVAGALALNGNDEDNTIYGTSLTSDTIEGRLGNDVIFGLGGVDTLRGQQGQDTLDGGSGGDAMSGGQDNDTYYVDNAADTAVEQANEGTDDQVFSAVNFALGAHVENLTLTGTAINGVGNGLDNRIIGNSQNNVLNGLGGRDLMRGGLGNDTYYVDNVGDTTNETNGGGGTTDTVYSLVTYTAAAGIERLTLIGFADIDAFGRNGQADALSGNGGSNTLDGRGGSDNLDGASGDDTLILAQSAIGELDLLNGGADSDTVDFSGFNHAVWVDFNFAGVEAQTRDTDNVTTGAWRTIADLSNIENLVDTVYSDQLLGSALDNIFAYTGNVGNVFDIYNARQGIDTADFSRFASAVWVDLNYAGAEAQTRDNAGLTSGTWRTIVDLTGFENITGTAHADSLSGNSLVNTLIGGLGNDDLRGRGGSDTFVFADGFGQDTIMDFHDTGSGWEDVIDLRGVTGVHVIGDLTIAYAANATITIGVNTISLTGVTSGLDSADFMFA